MPSAILPAFSRPAYGGGNILFARDEADERMRPTPPNHFADYLALLGTYPWQQLVSQSRAVGSRGIVAAALLQKADYVSASDWRAYFTGADRAYGKTAQQLLEDTNHLVCTRGERYDWITLWKLALLATHTDGGVFLLLTKSESGWPLLQPIEAHRVGSRGTDGEVKPNSAWTEIRDPNDPFTPRLIATPYVSLRIVNGIIYNASGAEVAYRVLGQTPEGDQDVSARDMIHIAPPRWFSEGRPAPMIAPGLLSLLGLELARSAQLDKHIHSAQLIAVNQNETGRAIDAAKNAIMGGGPATVGDATKAPELVGRGTFKYIKNGNGLKPWETNTPGTEWNLYDEKMLAAAINTFWRVEMLDPKELGGRNALLVQDAVNTHLKQAFLQFHQACRRATRYRIACYIQLKLLPDHPEFMAWEITPPPEVVTDRNASLVDIALVRAGAMSMPDLHRRAGTRPEIVGRQQATWLKMLDELADEFDVDVNRLANLNQRGDQSPLTQLSDAVKSGAITHDLTVENAARDELGIPPANTLPAAPTTEPTPNQS